MTTSIPPSIPNKENQELFQSLVEIVERLRGPQGCPWDKEQTQRSLTQYILEEAFELVEAIESGNQKEIAEELGDYLFQVVLQAQVAKDEGHFDIAQVIQTLNQKMIHRHPHVFSDTKVKDLNEVWKNWERLKAQEKAQQAPSQLFAFPRQLPALQAAHKIGVKTERFHFDWPNSTEVFKKVSEEYHELQEAHHQWLQEKTPLSQQHLEHEIGDLLFSISQLARHTKLEPEQCLRQANRRFEKRFTLVLELAKQKYGEDFGTKEVFATLSVGQMEELWQMAKIQLANPSNI